MDTTQKIKLFAERVNYEYKKVHNRLILSGYLPDFIFGNKEVGEETYYKPNEDNITITFSYIEQNKVKLPDKVLDII